MTARDKETLKSYFDTGDVPTSENIKDLIDSIPDVNDLWIINPMTDPGDMIIGGTSGIPTKLPIDDDGKILKLVSGIPSWANESSPSLDGYLKLDASNGPVTADLDIHGVVVGRGPFANNGNVKVGKYSLASLLARGSFDNNGSFNSVFGESSGNALTIGEKNCFFGYYSGTNMIDGKENLIMGTDAGIDALGDRNVILGASTDPVPNESDNSIVIGYNAKGLGSNTTVIGNTDTAQTKLFGVLNCDQKTPSSSSDTGKTGDICWDSDYVYACVATNTWKRSPLTTW